MPVAREVLWPGERLELFPAARGAYQLRSGGVPVGGLRPRTWGSRDVVADLGERRWVIRPAGRTTTVHDAESWAEVAREVWEPWRRSGVLVRTAAGRRYVWSVVSRFAGRERWAFVDADGGELIRFEGRSGKGLQPVMVAVVDMLGAFDEGSPMLLVTGCARILRERRLLGGSRPAAA